MKLKYIAIFAFLARSFIANASEQQEAKACLPKKEDFCQTVLEQLEIMGNDLEELQVGQEHLLRTSEIIESDVSANFSNLNVVKTKVCAIVSKIDNDVLPNETTLNSKIDLLLSMVAQLLNP